MISAHVDAGSGAPVHVVHERGGGEGAAFGGLAPGKRFAGVKDRIPVCLAHVALKIRDVDPGRTGCQGAGCRQNQKARAEKKQRQSESAAHRRDPWAGTGSIERTRVLGLSGWDRGEVQFLIFAGPGSVVKRSLPANQDFASMFRLSVENWAVRGGGPRGLSQRHRRRQDNQAACGWVGRSRRRPVMTWLETQLTGPKIDLGPTLVRGLARQLLKDFDLGPLDSRHLIFGRIAYLFDVAFGICAVGQCSSQCYKIAIQGAQRSSWSARETLPCGGGWYSGNSIERPTLRGDWVVHGRSLLSLSLHTAIARKNTIN